MVYESNEITIVSVGSQIVAHSRNRKWAHQAQYNRFVREWVKEIGLAAIFTTAIGVWVFGRGR